MNTTTQLLLNFLVNAAWQICLIALVAWLAERLTRSLNRIRHLVWVLALLASFLLPALSAIRTLRSAAVVPATNVEMPRGSTPTLVVGPAEATSPSVAVLPRRLQIGQTAALILIALALGIVLFRSSHLWAAWWQTRRLRASTTGFTPENELRAVIERCRQVFGIGRVRIGHSELLQTPATIGFFAPLVIIPGKLIGEADVNALSAAIGHEFVHIMRRDYLLNLIYEFLLLPISWHPAAMMIKRRITQTRELRCDELVAERLLHPEIYARSLVRLAGSALPPNRRAQTMIVGIADADILEVRIMSLLKRNKTNLRRNIMLVTAAALVFAIPCIAAAAFAINFEVSVPGLETQEPQPQQMKMRRSANTERERVEQELKEQAEREDRELLQKIEKETNPSLKADLEETLRRRTEEREKMTYTLLSNGVEYKVMAADDQRRKIEDVLQKELEQERSTLAKAARITMEQAIQIATSSNPGKVLESNLEGERSRETNVTTARPLYHVTILSGDDAESVITHVWINGLDGTIVKKENELRRKMKQEMSSGEETKLRRRSSGTLNDKAVNLPNPEYPLIAMKAGAEGAVDVEVTVDETGHVIAAHAISGHPLLQAAAVTAARQAVFQPTSVNGELIKVSGLLRYEFEAK